MSRRLSAYKPNWTNTIPWTSCHVLLLILLLAAAAAAAGVVVLVVLVVVGMAAAKNQKKFRMIGIRIVFSEEEKEERYNDKLHHSFMFLAHKSMNDARGVATVDDNQNNPVVKQSY
jgi:P pilus assembly chaperone PapD